MKFIKIFVLVGIAGLLFYFFRNQYKSEIRHESTASLPSEKLGSILYPWSTSPNVVTEVVEYKEVYDLDSNDWIAQFMLNPEEAKMLSKTLIEIPDAQKKYRCVTSNVDWQLRYDLCSFEQMKSADFRGYFYNPSLCQSGCKQKIILWVNEQSGESYIVSSPDNEI